MIQYKDFVPTISKKFLVANDIESLSSIMEKVNEWFRRNETLEIINIETLVLPNIHNNREEGSQDTELYTGGEVGAYWYQVIRVWYR